MFRWISKTLAVLRSRTAEDAGDPAAAPLQTPHASEAGWRDPAVSFARGNEFAAQGRLDDAIESYRSALRLRPEFPEAACNLGTALKERGFVSDAISCYEDAIRLRPAMFEAHFDLGLAYQALGEFERALGCFERAVSLRADSAEAQYALGYLYANEDRRDAALRCFARAVAVEPDYAEARWGFAMSQLLAVCGPEDDAEQGRAAFGSELERLERWFGHDRKKAGERAVGSIAPFRLAYHEDDHRDVLARYGALCTRIMSAWVQREPIATPARRQPGEAVRIALVSRYFRRHSVWNAIVKGWLLNLDYRRYILSAFALGPEQDADTLFAQARAVNFEQGMRPLADWIRAIQIQRPHVVIYPEIGMDPMTIRLAALRLAPVQIAAWGHPETTGLPTIDYYLSAEDFEPPDAQRHYTERLVRLPRLGCFMEPSQITPVDPPLAEWNLDPARPILICPGTPFKYAPRDDRLWTRVASRIEGCQLVFFKYRQEELSTRLQRRLEAAFCAAGVDPGRHLRFLPWLDPAQFHGLMRRADAYLDTVGFSGFNTAMQAIDCGLPIVTRDGRFMRGRFAAGILRRLGLPALVAATDDEYVALAARLIEERSFADDARRQISDRRDSLYHDLGPIREMERLLERVTA